MKHIKSSIFIALTIIPLSPVYAEDSKSHASNTDAQGTTTTTDTSRSNTVGLTGTQKTTSDEKTVVDPKGLMNKESSTAHHERKVKSNGDVSDTTTRKHADGTTEENSVEKSTSGHLLDKGVTSTTTKTHTIDPPGLGNKHKVVEEDKTVTDGEGSGSRTVTKKGS